MARNHEYTFLIDAFTPDTLPMARLAEYMADLAAMLGEPANVHFVRLEEGSAMLIQKVDKEAAPKVRERVRRVLTGQAPNDALAAYRRVNKRLKEDNGVGVLAEAGEKIIRFPGREQPEAITFGAFKQEGSLDGVIIRLGGRQAMVPVHIECGERLFTHCFASRELAKTLARYLFGPELRFYGEGRWYRDEDARWVLERFTISRFDPLDEAPLSAVVGRLRNIRGSEWPDVDDPWVELDQIRHGDGV